RLREQLNPRLAVAGILACRLRRTNLARDVLARLRERFGDLVLQSVVRESVRLAEAPTARAPITDFDPRGAAAEDYRAVARELLAGGRGRGGAGPVRRGQAGARVRARRGRRAATTRQPRRPATRLKRAGRAAVRPA